MTKPAAGYLDLDDIRIAYSEHGSGPNLILLHGNSGSKEMLRSYQTSHFTDFHTWALDSRCHGRSRSDDDSLSIEQIGDDVIRFCRAKGIAEAGVIGYSDGGNIALFLAKKEPALFPRVIAISPNYLVSGTTDSGLRPRVLLNTFSTCWVLIVPDSPADGIETLVPPSKSMPKVNPRTKMLTTAIATMTPLIAYQSFRRPTTSKAPVPV